MTAEQILYDALDTTGYKIFPQYAPDNEPNPFLIYLMVADTRLYGLDEVPSDVQTKRFQVDIYVDGYSDLLTMKDTVTTAINAIDPLVAKPIIYGTRDLADEYGRRTVFDLQIWVTP